MLDIGKYLDAGNLFVQLQKRTDPKSVMTICLLNNIATAKVMRGTKEVLDEADSFSKIACIKMLWQTEFKWTRGLLLAEQGNIEQGLALLKEIVYKLETSDSKAIYAYHIVEVENKNGNASDAGCYYGMARFFDPKAKLYQKIIQPVINNGINGGGLT